MSLSPIERNIVEKDVVALAAVLTQYPHIIDHTDSDGWSMLFYAVQHDETAMVELLVRSGSKLIASPVRDGVYPIHEAIFQGSVKMVETLVRLERTTLYNRDKHGRTPMHIAAVNDNRAIIETLVRLGSDDIDTPDYSGNTPLHAAAEMGDLKGIKTLMRLGSTSFYKCNNDGRTPIQVCDRETINTYFYLYIIDGLGSSYTQPHVEFDIGEENAVTEEECQRARYSIYFKRSLSARLLFTNDRLLNQRLSSTMKI